MVDQLTPEQIAVILNQNASRPATPVEKPSALAPSQNDIPKMISEEPFSFSSPDVATRTQPAPLTPFTAPTENPLNLLESKPVETVAPTDLLAQRRVDIVAGPFSIGSFNPPPAPPVAPPPTAVPAQVPVVQSVPVIKKVKRKRKAKPNVSQINVGRSK